MRNNTEAPPEGFAAPAADEADDQAEDAFLKHALAADPAMGSKAAAADEIARLRARNAELAAENDRLKATAPLFSAGERLPRFAQRRTDRRD